MLEISVGLPAELAAANLAHAAALVEAAARSLELHQGAGTQSATASAGSGWVRQCSPSVGPAAGQTVELAVALARIQERRHSLLREAAAGECTPPTMAAPLLGDDATATLRTASPAV